VQWQRWAGRGRDDAGRVTVKWVEWQWHRAVRVLLVILKNDFEFDGMQSEDLGMGGTREEEEEGGLILGRKGGVGGVGGVAGGVT
jgi:hypothetical protein